MKKTLSMILATLLVGTMAVSASAAHIFEADQGKIAFDVQKASAIWSPDGNYEVGEYYDIDVQPGWISTMCGQDDLNEKTANLDVNLAMSWDNDYLYVYVKYVDLDGFNFTAARNPDWWNGDIIQFGAADADAVGDGTQLEIGCGQYSDSGEKSTYNWKDVMGSGYWANGSNVGDDFEVTFDGNTVIYEFRVPFSAFTAKTAAIGEKFGVCLCVNWTDGGEGVGSYATWQLASGISGGKTPENFAKITLQDAPVIETEPETVVEEVVADAAPATFDAGIVAAVAAIVSAAGYALSKKH